MPKQIKLTPEARNWDVEVAGQSIPLSCGAPHVEVVNESVSRLVIEMPTGTAKAIAHWAEVPVYPATPEGAVALSAAAKELASAAYELVCVLKERK